MSSPARFARSVVGLSCRAAGWAPRQIARWSARPLSALVPAPPRPSPSRALKQYQGLAERYDRWTASGQPYRRQTVLKLAPAPGEVVLEVGCGTGLNFASIEEGIGPQGRLIGVDVSSAMLELARERAERHGWRNVTLLEAPAEDAHIPVAVDAALFCGTHDILRSPAAVDNVLRHVRPGGRVVAGGPKWVPWWVPGGVQLNLYTWQLNRRYVTTFEGFDRPWSHLAELIPDLQVDEVLFGTGYIASGNVPDEPRGAQERP